MKMRNAAMAMTMAAMVALSACGGSSKPAETQAAAAAETAAAAASEAAGAAAEAAGELKEITAGMLEGPVILTSVGQSADVDIVNTLCTKAGIDLEKNNGITADDLPADCKTLILAVGGSSKGLGADYVFMWDTANVSIVEPRQATEVIFGKWSSELEQQFRDTQSSAVALARHGFADKVIAPEDSRKYLIGALQTFVNSR